MNHTTGAQRTNAKYAKILAEVDRIATQKAYDSMSPELFENGSIIVVTSQTSKPNDNTYAIGKLYLITDRTSLLCRDEPKYTHYRCNDENGKKVLIAHRDCKLHISSPGYYPRILPNNNP